MHPLATTVLASSPRLHTLASRRLPACGSEREGARGRLRSGVRDSALLSAWPRVRARADRRPLYGGLRHNGDTSVRDCVFSLTRPERLSPRGREPGRKVFQKPIRAKRASRRFRSLRRARKSARPRLPPVYDAQKLTLRNEAGTALDRAPRESASRSWSRAICL